MFHLVFSYLFMSHIMGQGPSQAAEGLKRRQLPLKTQQKQRCKHLQSSKAATEAKRHHSKSMPRGFLGADREGATQATWGTEFHGQGANPKKELWLAAGKRALWEKTGSAAAVCSSSSPVSRSL